MCLQRLGLWPAVYGRMEMNEIESEEIRYCMFSMIMS
jgi:hypothetical protein